MSARFPFPEDSVRGLTVQQPWAESDAAWHWELTDVCPLSEPLPTAGGRGLWRPTQTLLGRVQDHLPSHAWRRPAGLDEALEGAT